MKRRLHFLFYLFLFCLLAAGTLRAFDFNKLRPKNKSKFSTKQPIAVAAVRGIDEPAGETGDPNARDEESIAWLESQTTSDADLSSFLTQGGLLP